MKNIIFEKNSSTPVYVQLYYYFRRLIESGQLGTGAKMMSIRRCCDEFDLSKTTVESAYLQLAAEGYIISKPQSGYYVCEIKFIDNPFLSDVQAHFSSDKNDEILFDYTSSAVDSESFDFSLWQRYIKSALRQSERLTSYGEAQGEPDLRAAVSQYVNESRSVVCRPEQIVIGAGTQNLLGILCALVPQKSNIVFIGSSFERGEAVFENHGHKCFSLTSIPESFEILKKMSPGLIYISPSHITKAGDILPINRRLELLSYAKENNCLIIEDDYDSEFRYYSKPVPSLQGIAGGNEVIYISTFSKLLIPSIRISFMVLPFSLLEKYRKRGRLYNQTASKLEQIALCQFIRDGHLKAQIKKQRKLFSQKAKILCDDIKAVFGPDVKSNILPAGYLVGINFKSVVDSNEIADLLKRHLIKVTPHGNSSIILSCTGVASEENITALNEIKSVIEKYK